MVSLPTFAEAEDLLSDNLWFKQHPEKILGEVKTCTNRFGKEEEYVVVHGGLSVQDELNKISAMLPKVEQKRPELKTYHTLKEEDVKDLDIVTTSKITARELDKPEYSKVAVGVEPTIWHEHNAQAPATMLRPSTTPLDNNSIAQNTEKPSSSEIIERKNF